MVFYLVGISPRGPKCVERISRVPAWQWLACTLSSRARGMDMATLEISYATFRRSKEEIFQTFSFAVLLVNFALVMRLDDDKFLKIIEATPLVSIDLIIRNAQGQVLLGKRLNRPAQGFW